MSKSLNYTQQELEFIKTNILIKGTNYCSSQLNMTVSKIRRICIKENILIKKKREINNKKDNPFHLSSLLTPESIYTLGFIWGDGYVVPPDKKSKKVCISINSEDGFKLLPIFNVLEEWGYSFEKRRQETWVDQVRFVSKYRSMHSFLIDNNYHNKSGASANLILSKIPEHLKPLFFRGLSDADGCFYVGKNNTTRQYSISSCFNQNWDFLEDLLNSLDIKYSLDKTSREVKENKLNSYSQIRFTGPDNITKWGNYIYSSYGVDGIGLPRKHAKYVECFRAGRIFGKVYS